MAKKFVFLLTITFICGICFFSAGEAAMTLHYPEKYDIGQPFVVFVSSDVPLQSASVVWFDIETPLEVIKYDGGYRAHGLFGADANRIKDGAYPIEFRVAASDDEVVRGIFRIDMKIPKYSENRLTVPPKMVNPPQSELKRIEDEIKLSSAARMTMTPNKMWQIKATMPLDGKIHITSSYGYRRIYNGSPRGRHSGTDFRAKVGTPLRSLFAGKVILSGDFYFAGKNVYIDSGNGVVSAYYHLDSIKVKNGDILVAGDIIGTSGKTGRVTGPHLHLSVFLSGHSIDPMGLLDIKFQEMVNNLRRGDV